MKTYSQLLTEIYKHDKIKSVHIWHGSQYFNACGAGYEQVDGEIFENIIHNWSKINDNEDLGKSVNEIQEHLHSYHKSSDEDRKHLDKYHNYSSRELNNRLMDHHKNEEKIPNKILGHDIKGLDKAISKNKINHDMHVYSGISFNPKEEMNSEGKVHVPGYLSTSISKKIAEHFADKNELDDGSKHILHIHLKKGQKGTYVGKNSSYDEYEFLMPRGHILKINKTPDVHFSNKGKFHVWHAEIVKK